MRFSSVETISGVEKIAWTSVRRLGRFCDNDCLEVRASLGTFSAATFGVKRLFRLHRRYRTQRALNLIQVKNPTNGATLRRLLPPTEQVRTGAVKRVSACSRRPQCILMLGGFVCSSSRDEA
jgi:hypothetical protein